MIRLETFALGDIDRLLSWVEPTEAFLIQWAGTTFTYPLDREQLTAHVEAANSDTHLLTAVDDATDESVAHLELWTNKLHGLGRLSRILISPQHRGRGLCRPITNAALSLAFDHLGLRRVELSVFEFNAPAIRCYEAVGFRREGVKREFAFTSGRYCDLIEMGILKREWGKTVGHRP